MIDPRDSVPALLELASQAATDGVRATALRRIALLAEEELGRARSHADLDAMRESLRPALPALRAHAAVSGTLALFERHSRAESHASTRPAVQSPLVRTISHAMTLGVPSLVASPVVSDSRAARCVRRLLQASPDRFSGIADDAGCRPCVAAAGNTPQCRLTTSARRRSSCGATRPTSSTKRSTSPSGIVAPGPSTGT